MAKAKSVGYAKYRLSPLKKITDLAKQIRKQHPNMKYTDAVKKAGAQYRAGKTAKPAARKKAAVKKVSVKKAAVRKAVVRKVKAKKAAKKKSVSNVKQGALFGRSNSMQALSNIKDLQLQIIKQQDLDARYKLFIKNRANTKSDKDQVRRQMKTNADYIRTLKKQVQSLKKHIK